MSLLPFGYVVFISFLNHLWITHSFTFYLTSNNLKYNLRTHFQLGNPYLSVNINHPITLTPLTRTIDKLYLLKV